MEVFISWSGQRSKAVAELLDEWIQCVIQAVRPWMSSKHIDRGSLWFSEIADRLKDTRIGVVCLTNDNISKPWILFEAGALSKGLTSSRVCTFLIDLEPEDISDPLAQFNHTCPTKDGLYELVSTINATLDDRALNEKVLEQVFETYWPQFEERFQIALEENPAGEAPPQRTDQNMLSEILRNTRNLDRRIRSVESNIGFSDRVRKFSAPPKLVRKEIAKMIEDGVPSSMIEDRMEGLAPLGYIRECMHEEYGVLDESLIAESGGSSG